jgi:hypothetical protein
MSSRTLYRWSGTTLIVGGLLSLVSSTLNAILFPDTNPTPQQLLSVPWLIAEILLFAGLLLIVMGFPGSYLRQAARAGRLGFVGSLLLWLGVLLALGFSVVRITLWPYLAQLAPNVLPLGGQGPVAGFLLWILVPWLLLSLGSLLLGAAVLRARAFPLWPGILLLIAGILSILTFILPPSGIGEILDPVSDGALFLALAWIGYTLIANPQESVARHPAAAPTAQTE